MAGVASTFSNRRVMLMESVDLTWELATNMQVFVPSASLELTNTFESARWVKMMVPVKIAGMICKPLTQYLSVCLAGKYKEHHDQYNKSMG
jgi:hypothetical protein